MQEAVPESSRLLAALEKKRGKSQNRMADAISFGQFRKDGGTDV
jgi:hypothetical protein